MNRQILNITLPSIVSNITVPLLALVDTTIVGHLGAASYLGGIAVGGMLFNMAYWLFGFLRMGTGGMTAQAYGAGRIAETLAILFRSLLVALTLGLSLILLQHVLVNVAFQWINATPEVENHARTYFACLIWGAPAVLAQYSLLGWFLGMQNARFPMYVAIVQNVVNIATSLLFVMGFGWKIEGVAIGTLIAQYAGMGLSVLLWFKQYYQPQACHTASRLVMNAMAFRRFFSVNRDIFLRTLCLIAVSTYFTSAGAARGDLALAANTLLMQFFILFSYVMDGFAYAGEALGGRYYGARSRTRFSLLARRLFQWGLVLAGLFTAAYALGGELLVALLTNDAAVRTTAADYLPYAVAIPLISFPAFLFDGLFIGTTSTRQMLLSMAFAAGAYFAILAMFPASNPVLWTAFLVYLGSRGAVQGLLYPRIFK